MIRIQKLARISSMVVVKEMETILKLKKSANAPANQSVTSLQKPVHVRRPYSAITMIRGQKFASNSPMVVVMEMKTILKLKKSANAPANQSVSCLQTAVHVGGTCRAITMIRMQKLARNSSMVVVKEMETIFLLRNSANAPANQIVVACLQIKVHVRRTCHAITLNMRHKLARISSMVVVKEMETILKLRKSANAPANKSNEPHRCGITFGCHKEHMFSIIL
ncbi:uncharacterized protein [Aquarana catesbeiana]|uniref:uncharacterized protein n=1 Tax=Aquarana catesbeiana TaxID=8400 RepID=UPI003CCA53E4